MSYLAISMNAQRMPTAHLGHLLLCRSFLAPLGAGAAAGLAASFIRVPTEVVKQRLQSGQLHYGNAILPCCASR